LQRGPSRAARDTDGERKRQGVHSTLAACFDAKSRACQKRDKALGKSRPHIFALDCGLLSKARVVAPHAESLMPVLRSSRVVPFSNFTTPVPVLITHPLTYTNYAILHFGIVCLPSIAELRNRMSMAILAPVWGDATEREQNTQGVLTSSGFRWFRAPHAQLRSTGLSRNLHIHRNTN